MRRLNVLLRKIEEGRGVELLNADRASLRREKVIAGLQARSDHLPRWLLKGTTFRGVHVWVVYGR